MEEMTLPVTLSRVGEQYVPLPWELPASIGGLRASELPEGEGIPGEVCKAYPEKQSSD